MCSFGKDVKEMKKIIDFILEKIAGLARVAAAVSVGTASCSGMYEPKRPKGVE